MKLTEVEEGLYSGGSVPPALGRAHLAWYPVLSASVLPSAQHGRVQKCTSPQTKGDSHFKYKATMIRGIRMEGASHM